MPVDFLKVVLGYFHRFINTFTDRDARNHDDELTPAVFFVQLIHGAEIGVGLTRSGLHLHGEVVASLDFRRAFNGGTLVQVMRALHFLDVLEDLMLCEFDRRIAIANFLFYLTEVDSGLCICRFLRLPKDLLTAL